MSFKLRPYQADILNRVRFHISQGSKKILIVLPTGGGKTALMADMLSSASKKGNSSTFIVHRRELVKQSVDAFIKQKIEHGIVSSGFDFEPGNLVNVASIQTLARREGLLKTPKIIVIDEAHHAASKTWASYIEDNPDSFIIGLTATPQRLDGRGLSQWFDVIVEGPQTAELIEQGYLSPYRYFAPAEVDLSQVKTIAGDYSKKELTEIMEKPHITGNALNEYRKLKGTKKTIAFCCSIVHSLLLVEQFNQAGIPSAHIDGATPKHERDFLIEQFRSGEISLLSSVDIFSEGFDLPAAEMAMLLRPTQSLSLFLQQCGRVLRIAPGKKEALILDFVGNARRHGLPDQERNWSLDGQPKLSKKEREESFSVKVCPKCFMAQEPTVKICINCGAEIPKSQRELKQIAGELEELKRIEKKKELKNERKNARTLEDLIELGKQRGYRPGWSHAVWKARGNYGSKKS